MNLHEIIAEILYDHLKGKHKDELSIKLANQIIEAFAQYYENLPDTLDEHKVWCTYETPLWQDDL